jgi:hypothetical protein
MLRIRSPGAQKDEAPFFGDMSSLKIGEVKMVQCECPHDR